MLRAVITLSFCLLFSISQTGLHAQQLPQQQPAPATEISDEELVSFVDASDAIRPIQLQMQEDIQETIEDYGFTMERFQEIVMIFQNPEMEFTDHVSAEEEQALETMEPVLIELETAARNDMVEEISAFGLNVERYQAIFMGLQQDPALIERIESLTEQ